MVVINLKVSDKNQFLYQTATSIEISQLIKELVLGKSLTIIIVIIVIIINTEYIV